MKDIAMLLPAATLLMQELHDKQLSQEEFSKEYLCEPEPKELPPPWETARIDIPKSMRKGKTWEEIKEIKKQIWEEQQK